MNFGNGAKIRYEYDAFGRTTAIYVDEPDPNNEGSVIVSDTAKYEFKYDARGIASVIKDNVLMTETRVTSDLADRPSESVTRDANGNLIHKSVLNYDGKNRVKEFIDILPEVTHKTEYTYDADNRVTEVKYDNSDTHKVNYSYDLLNRITTKCATNGVPYTTTYGFVDGDTATYGANATTPLISTITQGSGANAMNFTYTYDNRGIITSETRNGVTVSYEYDELGQLIRVNDPNDPTAGADGTTWVYTYDRGGNILNKAAHVYTTGEVSPTDLQWGYTYDENWKDKLIGYKDKTFTYDDIGNPIFDLNDYHIRHFDWEAGRRLKELSGNGYSIEYKYDHNGIRTYKKWQPDWHPVIVNYILRGKQIAQMTVDYRDRDEIPHQDVLYFYYDAQDKLAQVSWNGEIYTYVHNLQGDIVGILDSTGVLVVEYKYDAWGRPLGTSGSMAETLGRRNPFRYRGYVYDEDSGLYYLRSRYYDPEWGRYLNADVNLGQGFGIFHHSLFTYCKNCGPVYYDPDGAAFLVTLYIGCMTYIATLMQSSDLSWDIESLAMSLAEGDVTGIVCDVASIAIPGLSGIKGIKFLESADEVAAIGKASKVIQTFDVGDEADHIAKSISDLLAAQKHHGLPNPPMKYIARTVPDLEATKIVRNDWIFRAKDLQSHLGYDKVHRELTAAILEDLSKSDAFKTGKYTREDVVKMLNKIYENKVYRERFGNILFR